MALVTAAIALWITVYLGRALNAARRRGELILDTLLAHLTPLGWHHINLAGDYLWRSSIAVKPYPIEWLDGDALGVYTKGLISA